MPGIQNVWKVSTWTTWPTWPTSSSSRLVRSASQSVSCANISGFSNAHNFIVSQRNSEILHLFCCWLGFKRWPNKIWSDFLMSLHFTSNSINATLPTVFSVDLDYSAASTALKGISNIPVLTAHPTTRDTGNDFFVPHLMFQKFPYFVSNRS